MIKIVTDSASDISPHLAAELAITVMPVRISFGSKVYYDGHDIDRASFYRYLARSTTLPVTEPPLLEEFQQVYGQFLKGNDQVLCIHTSGKLSRTVRVAHDATAAFLGRSKITVADSRLISGGLELVVTVAAEAAQRGASVDEIVRLIRGVIPHIYMVFFTDNLEYVERHVHAGRSRALTENLPGVRPLLILEEGEIVPMDRVRTRGKSVDRLFEFVAEFARFERVVILQGRLADEAQMLFERLRDVFREKRLDIKPYGPSLATYLGPDALGVVVYEGM